MIAGDTNFPIGINSDITIEIRSIWLPCFIISTSVLVIVVAVDCNCIIRHMVCQCCHGIVLQTQ